MVAAYELLIKSIALPAQMLQMTTPFRSSMGPLKIRGRYGRFAVGGNQMKVGRREFAGASLLSMTGFVAVVRAQDKEKSPEQPQTVVLRGRVVCLAEEYQKLYQAVADCEHRGHTYALKTDAGKLYPFLPTDTAAAIYLDERYRVRELQVTARIFPQVSFIEVIKLQSWRDKQLYNLYYFCDVCNIATHKPGPCECCQEPVQFRETLVGTDDQP